MPSTITSVTQFHPVDPLLTNFSVAYMQRAAGFIGGTIAPVVPVSLQTAKYTTFPLGTFMHGGLERRPLGGRFPRRNRGVPSTGSYSCEETGLEVAIDRRERANAVSPLDPEMSAVNELTQAALIDRDKAIASTVFTTGVWNTNIAGHASTNNSTLTPFWDLDTTDFVANLLDRIQAAEQATGFAPNSLLLGAVTGLKIVQNDTVKSYVSGGATTGQPSVVTLSRLEQWFAEWGYPLTIRVAKALEDTQAHSPSMGSPSLSYIWNSKSALLYYRSPEATPQMREPSAFYTFAWTGLLGGEAFPQGTQIAIGRKEEDYGTTVLSVQMAYDVKVVAPELGVFFSNVVQ